MTVAVADEVPMAVPHVPAGLRVTDEEFRTFQHLIYAEAGIRLGPSKKALLAGRLARRLRQLSLPSLAAYHRHLTQHPEERVHLLDCITTNETRFFREPRQFEFLEQRVLPDWTARAAKGERPRRVRAWSAGCASGEEPYSLAMLLLSQCPPEDGWDVEVVGTDLSTRALDRARAGVWPAGRAKDIPHDLLKRFMLRGIGGQEGWIKATPESRSPLRLGRLNLMSDRYPLEGTFDLIFCRNVLIYFDAASKAHVIRRLLDRLAPGGYLFLGHAESLGRTEPLTRSVSPNVYALEAERS